MAKSPPINIASGFPVGGLHKGTSLQGQPENTTASALNVWPQDWEGGRARGGSRPGIDTVAGTISGTPYHWSRAEWIDGDKDPHVGIALLTSGNAYMLEGSSTDSDVSKKSVTDAGGASGPFSSITVYQQYVLVADQGEKDIQYEDLTEVDDPPSHENDLTTITTTSGLGFAPTYCGLITTYADRLVISGDKDSPQAVYMSRVGTINDWDYTEGDGAAAWANAGAVPGKLGETVNCLFEHNRNCLLIGSTDSLYIIRGNPAAGGSSIELMSREVGPISKNAICKTGSEHTILMTRHGLYRMSPGCGEPPVNMSDEKLPDDLSDLDPKTDTASLVYDAKFRGIHILINRKSGDDDFASAFYYSLLHDSYWPMSFGAGTLTFGCQLKSFANATRSSALLLKTGTGYSFDTAHTESFTSRCLFGPFALGTSHMEGVLTELSAVLSEGSSTASWEVYAASSPQEAFVLAEAGTAPSFTGTDWDIKGLNYTQRPRVRGTVCYIKVFAIGASRWSLEELFGTAFSDARRRVR